MEYLEIADEHRTVTKSSISQARDTKLSLSNGVGAFLPIVFDNLDYIDCDRVKSHPIIVSTVDDLDYQYPVRECTYYTDEYVYVDEHGSELRTLPHWFGEGFYTKYVDTSNFINFDTESLGTRNKETLQGGLHYTTAIDTLE